MKIKKKTAMIMSVAVGTLMFATTAMAEVISKSGYEQAKDAIKYSADSLTSKVSNYTLDMSMTMKDNGKIIISENTLNKYDITKSACENVNTTVRGNKKGKSYYYRDKNGMVNTNERVDENIYYVTEFETPDEGRDFKNPFKEKEAGDIEKIVDAAVGNLKDYVIVDEKADGSKELSGSIKEAQIPALINAVTSYALKNETSINRGPEEDNVMPRITKDVYIKEVKGKMIVDKNGLIKSILGTGILSGKDKQGKEHELTIEILGKVTNVNSTVVNKPNLSGKKVEKHIQRNNDEFVNPEKYVGKYKSNIIIEKDGKFQKIGERILNITHSDNESIVGTYDEQYRKGYESYKTKASGLKFDAKYDKDKYNARFDIEGYSDKGNISIDRNSVKVYFFMPHSSRGGANCDDEFNRVFD
ncbi:hypothetical protein [Clostridium tetanomorphum]|uniref:Uncharacterized protein n=1 Tax=Clostridium tetanomorphum TaxID=1553 RepID=A0A923J1E9_CLOTT|nr:hypothetical protein [Clostridium tetanomorphum]MBC2399102.1 hypothetical protein [Clostridium tetanomorphum]NRZ95886.1 hypothetical protein [Clostridium tetanomorphum]